MAKFEHNLWTYLVLTENKHEPAVDSQEQLLVATLLWLRTLGTEQDNIIGLPNLIRILVAPSNKLYWKQNAPQLDYSMASNGKPVGIGYGAPILWASNDYALHRNLTLEYFQYVSREIRIHITWLEWALASAMRSLYNMGVAWQDNIRKPPETIGGIEKVDWL